MCAVYEKALYEDKVGVYVALRSGCLHVVPSIYWCQTGIVLIVRVWADFNSIPTKTTTLLILLRLYDYVSTRPSLPLQHAFQKLLH